MDTFDSYALFLLVVVPMAGATVLMFVPAHQARTVRWTASLFAFVSLAISIYVFASYDHEAGGFQFQARGAGWRFPARGPTATKRLPWRWAWTASLRR